MSASGADGCARCVSYSTNSIHPKVRHERRLALDPSVVLDIRPLELLSISWNDAHSPRRLNWVVTWTLRPEGQGTRLFLEHSGFDPEDPVQQLARTFMGSGWRSGVFRKLHDVLETPTI